MEGDFVGPEDAGEGRWGIVFFRAGNDGCRRAAVGHAGGKSDVDGEDGRVGGQVDGGGPAKRSTAVDVPGYENEPNFAAALDFPLVLEDGFGGGGRGRTRVERGAVEAEFLGVADGGAYCVPLWPC